MGADDPEPSEHSSDGDVKNSDPIEVQQLEDEDAEGDDDVVMEDANGQSYTCPGLTFAC